MKPIQSVKIPYDEAYQEAFDLYHWYTLSDEEIARCLFYMMGAPPYAFEILSADDGMAAMTVKWRQL